jgi:hypothetical protein
MAHIAKVFQTEKNNISAGSGQFAGVRSRGQTFKALSSIIRAISLYIAYDGGASGVGLKISFYNVNQTTNLPTGSAIYSFNVYPSGYTANKVNKLALPAAITTLIVNTKYCFTLEPVSTGGTYTDYYRDTWFTNDMTTYSDGISIKNTNGTWAIENLQMYFELCDDYTVNLGTADYSQPTLPDAAAPKKGWHINSVDAQITSRYWDQSSIKIANEVASIAALGVNYIAIAAPYNRPKYFKAWADAIHAAGLKVWYRANWNGWEGQNGWTPYMSTSEYLTRTYKFIIDNPTIFQSGDMFSVCVEPNNANDAGNPAFKTSGSFDITKYNQFLKDQVRYANKAFSDASITGVHTWATCPSLSLIDLAGQILDSGDAGNVSGIHDSDVTTYFGGRVAIDHYLNSNIRKTNSYWTKYSSDLDKVHTAFPNAKIMIGEWGYHTETDYGEQEQHDVYDQVSTILRTKPYVIGVNFWNHMAQPQSSLFTDSAGNIGVGRMAIEAVKRAFGSPNATRGWTN